MEARREVIPQRSLITKGRSKGRVVVQGKYRVNKVGGGFSSFEDGRDLKMFKFC